MSDRNHPYRLQPPRAFWRQSVSGLHCLDVSDWYRKKFPIDGLSVATAGSCFAQHIGQQLRKSGFGFLDAEPAPSFLSAERHSEFGYGVYSARYGNVYTTRQLLQLAQRAFGEFDPVERYWTHGSGVVDPFRPAIEPQPFSSAAEVDAQREFHLDRVRTLLSTANLLVYTMGLTEAWSSVEDGAVFPVAPGTAGGVFDATRHRLINLSYPDIITDLEHFLELVHRVNPTLKVILTVSPVPLLATATKDHVIVATSYSKATLRAAAGDLCSRYAFVDYFPSYEIISSHVMRGQFYEPDLRNVSRYGVEHVMSHFFSQHVPPVAAVAANLPPSADDDEDDIICEEELLSVFGA